ncbi:hypothetical protein CSUI_000872 [Cystoisospora suis]|uniref:Uncharacterized protein n=1 Tax=Cystoisospora suis TaxID=483139 RepID=A0A2C6KMP2_9APIC|nr:hypothetical protein CSUI_000872 [Cystoisospora suis]
MASAAREGSLVVGDDGSQQPPANAGTAWGPPLSNNFTDRPLREQGRDFDPTREFDRPPSVGSGTTQHPEADEAVWSHGLRPSHASGEVPSGGGGADGRLSPSLRDSPQSVGENAPGETKASVQRDADKLEEAPSRGVVSKPADRSERSDVHVSSAVLSGQTPGQSIGQDEALKEETGVALAPHRDPAAGHVGVERPPEKFASSKASSQEQLQGRMGQGKEGDTCARHETGKGADRKDVIMAREAESPGESPQVEANSGSAIETEGAAFTVGELVDRAIASVREAVRCVSRSVTRVAYGDFTELQNAREGLHRIATGDFRSLSPLEQCLSSILGDCSAVTEQVFPCAVTQPPVDVENGGTPKPPPILMVVSTPAGPYIRIVPDSLVDEAVKQGLVGEEDVQLQREFPLYDSRQSVI